MKNIAKILLLAFAVLPSASIRAQDAQVFHVVSVHKETAEEHGGERTAIRYLKVVGRFDGKAYTVEAMDAGWNEVLEAGKDYRASVKKGSMSIEVSWKGKTEKNSWRVLTVEELSTSNAQ
jgi:hypothetical protein